MEDYKHEWSSKNDGERETNAAGYVVSHRLMITCFLVASWPSSLGLFFLKKKEEEKLDIYH